MIHSFVRSLTVARACGLSVRTTDDCFVPCHHLYPCLASSSSARALDFSSARPILCTSSVQYQGCTRSISPYSGRGPHVSVAGGRDDPEHLSCVPCFPNGRDRCVTVQQSSSVHSNEEDVMAELEDACDRLCPRAFYDDEAMNETRMYAQFYSRVCRTRPWTGVLDEFKERHTTGMHRGFYDYFRRWRTQTQMIEDGLDSDILIAALEILPRLRRIVFTDFRGLVRDGEGYSAVCERTFGNTLEPRGLSFSDDICRKFMLLMDLSPIVYGQTYEACPSVDIYTSPSWISRRPSRVTGGICTARLTYPLYLRTPTGSTRTFTQCKKYVKIYGSFAFRLLLIRKVSLTSFPALMPG